MRRTTLVCTLLAFTLILACAAQALELAATKRSAMLMDAYQFRTRTERHQRAPKAYIDPQISDRLSSAKTNGIATSMSLLTYLNYVPAERQQGKCGNCWVWSGTALYEIMLSVTKGTKDRLSIQYLTSCKTYDAAERCACCGGDLGTFTAWYNDQGKVIPWSNANAAYADASRTCGSDNVCATTAVSCDSIAKDTSYAVDQFQVEMIETNGVSQSTAIANIKNVLNQKRAVEYSFALANSQDWDAFEAFWNNSDESVLWNPDKYCGKTYDSATGSAHATVLVGYNDDSPDPKEHYWIILDANGTAGGKRPNGLFRIPMYMNYDCMLKQGGKSDYVTHFEVLGSKTGKTLALNLRGNGSGRVTSDPPGLDCSTSNRSCSTNFPDGETVTLTAIPDSNSTFKGWTGGGCSGTGTTCEVILDDDVEIDDEFDSDCTYTISPLWRVVPAKGSTATIYIRGEDGYDCPSPEIVNTAPWIKTQASVFTRNRGTLKVFIGPKDTPGSREASITVGDETFEVEQRGITCKIASLTPTTATFPSAGGEGKFIVNSQTGCAWEATVDGAAAAWITIPSGASGSGTGEVAYRVAAKEPGKRRTGRISVSLTEGIGLKKTFTVIQDRN